MTDSTQPPPAHDYSSMALYRRLMGYLRSLWGVFFLSIIGYIMYAASNAWFADILRQLVDLIDNVDGISASERLKIPLLVIATVALRGLGGFLGSYFMAYIANDVIHSMRCQLLGRFLQLPTHYFDKTSSGHLLSTVTYNITQVNAAVSQSLAIMIREGLTIIALFIYLLYINWQLTLLFVAVSPIISLLVLYASKKFRKHSRRMQISMGDVTQSLAETFKGLKVIRSFGAEQQVSERFEAASERNRRQNLKMASLTAISTPVIQVVVSSALAMLIWLAMAPAALASISSGEFVAFITAAGLMLKPIRQLSRVNAAIQRGLAAAQSVFELMDQPTESNRGSHQVQRVKGDIEFRQIHFTYPDTTEEVLKDINFHCPAGGSVAIVGRSGSGKTTLVNLLPRFYDPGSGQILIDGLSHTDYELNNLRAQIALVSQQVVLFNGSIRDNVAYGDLANHNEAEIIAALENANAMEFVSQLPEGIHTLVGDDGLMLSGGQRQRIAIARALLKDAPILILDEATSALDTESERYIQQALETLMTGRTTFIIAHRLSTIENADHILVMDRGQIVEQGRHAQLLTQGGAYARLHQVNFSEA